MSLQQEHDVVVIGAGHNGLTAACYLAVAGLDVLVVEGFETIGGMSASGTPIEAAPQHVVNYCAGDLTLWPASPVQQELQLGRHGLRTVPANPSYLYLHPDGASLAIWNDPRRTSAEIRRFSTHDANAYLEYARFMTGVLDMILPVIRGNPSRPDATMIRRMIGRVIAHRRDLRKFGEFFLASGDEIIDTWFEHPITRATVHGFCANTSPVDASATSMTHLLFGFLHTFGVLRPIGGMQAIPQSLSNCLKAAGGSVLCNAPVAAIDMHNDRATGVTLTDGRRFRARHGVLASCDPRQVFECMLPPDTFSRQIDARVRNIPANRSNVGQITVNMGLAGRADLTRFEKWRGDGLDLRRPVQLIGSPEGTKRSFTRSSAGLMPDAEDLLLWTMVPTGVDPTQAPAGQDSLYIYCAGVPRSPEQGWADLEDTAAKAIIHRTAQFFDGIADLEIGRFVESPQTRIDRTGATNSCVLHVDFDFFRSGPLRPAWGFGGYRCPIGNLYLGGSGSHPGGAVTGLPGRGAAHAVLKDLGLTRRWGRRQLTATR